jgi:superfamily II DNA or RNA helicase
MVVDECHSAGAAEMQRVLKTERAFSLGLSATPKRESDSRSTEADFIEASTDENYGHAAFNDLVIG